MTLQILKSMIEDGTFHHATYRNDVPSLWAGLWIYRHDASGFRGFVSAGAFAKDSQDLDAAYELVRWTGVSVGAYGRG
jgi:hypothetical protein